MDAEDIFRSSIGCEIMLMIKARIRLIFLRYSSLWIISIHLWIICVSCVSHAFASVRCCLVVTCSERADLLALVWGVYCIFVTFPCGILGQVWYLTLSFLDLCRLSYFYNDTTQRICICLSADIESIDFYLVVSNSPMLLILNPSCKRMVGVKFFLIRFRPIGFSIQLHTRKPGRSIV